jgi:hypothetical protein
MNASRRIVGARTGVDSDMAEILPEARLEISAGIGSEMLSWVQMLYCLVLSFADRAILLSASPVKFCFATRTSAAAGTSRFSLDHLDVRQ